ncbi:hypothetical protein ASF24_02530 [Methylobacterium sp. Leaf86]|nr:hypothetical protein ASF24_02530 [Methylobacterium sp. Leaf86]
MDHGAELLSRQKGIQGCQPFRRLVRYGLHFGVAWTSLVECRLIDRTNPNEGKFFVRIWVEVVAQCRSARCLAESRPPSFQIGEEKRRRFKSDLDGRSDDESRQKDLLYCGLGLRFG